MSVPPPIQPAQLDYRNPETSRSYRFSVLPTLIAWLIVYGAVAALMFVPLPRMEQTFKDFKTELPGVTQLTLAFGRWFASIGWLMLLPIAIGVPFLLQLIPHHATPELSRARIWRLTGFTMFALLVLGVWFAFAALMPMVSLIQTVSAPRK